jgi:PTH1 family peptidyl-tRNA hydrolase
VKVIVGLGNPGREYAGTRHNVGWWVVDHLADVWRFEGWRKDGEAVVSNGMVGGVKVRLVKPQTFMNLSGDALKTYVRRPFWAAQTDLLVIVDDVALPVGRSRIRSRGSAGGHNGLKHIQHVLKSQEYARLRVGVGPDAEHQIGGDLADFVLGPFGKREREEILALMPGLTAACERWLHDGVEAAMNIHNNN